MQKQTIATHFGYEQKSAFATMAVPIYQTTAFDFITSEIAADRFCLKNLGPIYTRLTNPTTEIFEKRLCEMEGGSAAIATSSGQAAVFMAIANLAQNGDNIIVSNKVYGGTSTLLIHSMKRFGINARVFDVENPSNLANLIDQNTKAIFFETLSNPQICVANTHEISKIANKNGIVCIADNTVLSPYLYNPFNDGADVIIHSTSKYIIGQGTSIGGAVISAKSLNSKLKNNPRYPHFNEPDESYHGLIYANLCDEFDIFTLRARFGVMRDFGMTQSPFNSFLLIQGLETLGLRMKQHSKSALKIAKFLQNHKNVKSVTYPSLENSPYFNFAKTNFKNGYSSGLLCFEVENFDIAKQISNRAKIFSVVVNIGDSKSIITHPASTTHSQLSKDELKSAGISEGLIRLSVGLEDSDDLIDDLNNALGI